MLFPRNIALIKYWNINYKLQPPRAHSILFLRHDFDLIYSEFLLDIVGMKKPSFINTLKHCNMINILKGTYIWQ